MAQSSDRKGDHGGFGTRSAWNLDGDEHVYGHVGVVVKVIIELELYNQAKSYIINPNTNGITLSVTSVNNSCRHACDQKE